MDNHVDNPYEPRPHEEAWNEFMCQAMKDDIAEMQHHLKSRYDQEKIKAYKNGTDNADIQALEKMKQYKETLKKSNEYLSIINKYREDQKKSKTFDDYNNVTMKIIAVKERIAVIEGSVWDDVTLKEN